MMRVISVQENPEYKEVAIKYFPSKWTEVAPEIYEDCITHAVGVRMFYHNGICWKKEGYHGCAGLITNDFISRMDLYPWLCALYIDEAYRGNAYAVLLIEKKRKKIPVGRNSAVCIFQRNTWGITRNTGSAISDRGTIRGARTPGFTRSKFELLFKMSH